MANDVNPGINAEEYRLLQQVPIFALLADEAGRLYMKLHSHSYSAGAILFREGEAGDRFSIIVEGEVEIVKAMETPDERVLAVLGPGDFIGEMSLLYRDHARSASARAHTFTRMLELAQADFDDLLRQRPELAFHIMEEMSERLRSSEDATIRDLQEKNKQIAASRDALAKAYQELQEAQVQLITKEKIEHELQMARRIQASILPKETPTLPGWHLAAHWQPARAVSGDFYDFIPFPGGRWGLVIGDVTDKGVPAALVMATTRSVIRSTAISVAEMSQSRQDLPSGTWVSPGEVLRKVNNLLCPDMPANMFVTCFFSVLDPEIGRLRYANAGHNLPCLINTDGVSELRATGMPLGLIPDMQYDENETVLSPGDTILFYSDGLTEAHNDQKEMYDLPRLRKFLTGRTGEGLIGSLLRQLSEFTGPGWEQEDDVTLMTLERARTNPGDL